MRAAGMTVALSMCLLGSIVGAAFLPPDDQYSPHQSPYERDVARGSRGYQNWLEYHRNPSILLEPPENKPGITSPRASDLSRERNTRKNSTMQDLDILSLGPGSWNIATSRVISNFTKPEHPDLAVPKEVSEIHSASDEDPFEADDTFQDQGPGSVEVYKLDLQRENTLLAPQSKQKQSAVSSRNKSKIPKKTKGDEILWKLKPIEPSKTSLPAIFRQPPSVYRGETISRALQRKIEENRKIEMFDIGGVPELQIGCEGLEKADRKRRSNEEEDSDEEYWPRFKDPVYKESTEPILLRVTPIVLDFEDEPPAGKTYEELDELLKLKSTTPEPTTRRTNRGDIDPDYENYQHGDATIEEKLPERGDLGPNTGKDSGRVERSISRDDSQDGETEDVRLTREANGNGKEKLSHLTARISVKDDDTLSTLIARSESVNHRGSRKLLQYPEKEDYENRAKRRHHREVNEREGDNLWGFGEDDGVETSDDDESEANKLKNAENETRRREYENRRLKELERRRGGHRQRDDNVHSGVETIQQQYERQQEQEQRERQKGMDERKKQVDRRQWHEEQRRMEEAKRRQSEEGQRRNEEEARRNPSHSRRRDEEQRRRELMRRKEEEERQVRLEDERSNQDPPSRMTRPSSSNRTDSRLKNRHGEENKREEEERKLREYIERNRPINVKKNEARQRPREHGRSRNVDDEQRKHIEEQRRRRIEDERRRQQMEEHRRRQESPENEEMRRQMKEQRRRDRPDEDRTKEHERRRQMEEQRRNRPDEDERRKHMEEQRRRDRPDDDRVREDERRRQMEKQRTRDRPAEDRSREDERRRHMEEQRRRDQPDEEERRRQMEEQRRLEPDDPAREAERTRQMEEQRRRNRPHDDRARDEEKRRRLEEERKLQDYVKRNQAVNVPRRNSSQERDLEDQRHIIEEARQWERNRQQIAKKNDGRSHGPAAPTNTGHRQSQQDLEERRKFEEEGRRREEEYRQQESRRHEEERLRLEAQRRREEINRRRPSNWQDSRRPMSTPHTGAEVRDRDAGELRKHETTQGLPDNSRSNSANEWRRRSEERERERQQQQHEERERIRIENERNSRNNERRRPQQGNTRLTEVRGESVRSQEEADRMRREEARLSALPVSARIIVRTDERSSRTGGSISPTNIRQPPTGTVGSRDGFGNEIDFPAISPNRPGLAASRFPAPPTQRPPIKSPSACVWAIVNCCPANNRLSTCFESMGCPGGHWDPSPCRPAIQSAAQEQVLNFYEKAENDYTRG